MSKATFEKARARGLYGLRLIGKPLIYKAPKPKWGQHWVVRFCALERQRPLFLWADSFDDALTSSLAIIGTRKQCQT